MTTELHPFTARTVRLSVHADLDVSEYVEVDWNLAQVEDFLKGDLKVKGMWRTVAYRWNDDEGRFDRKTPRFWAIHCDGTYGVWDVKTGGWIKDEEIVARGFAIRGFGAHLVR